MELPQSYTKLLACDSDIVGHNDWKPFPTIRLQILYRYPGGRLNKKDGLTRYGDSHVKDKTS